MSSRVQKGNTVFKPVVKARPRTVPAASVSRQSSELRVDSAHDPAPGAISYTSPTSIFPPRDQNGPTEPVSQQPDPGTKAGHTLNRLDTAPEERHVASRASTVPPVIGASIINIPTRPVQLILTPTQPRISQPINPEVLNSTGTSTPNAINYARSSDLTGISGSLTLEKSFHENTFTNVPFPSNGSNLSMESEITTRPSSTLTGVNSMVTLPDGHERPLESVKPTTRRRKSQGENSKKSKRPRTASKEGADLENEDVPLKRSRSRASSGTPRPRKRAPSPPPYDPDADPGEEIDPTTVTMAALCSDTGQGRVSRKAAEILSNHATWKVKNREKRARMKTLMEAKKYGREEEEEEHNVELGNQEQPAASEAGPSTTSSSAPIVDDTGSGFDYSQDLAASRYNVQVRIGPNGETVIDEESLIVDRAENDGTENYTHVVESDHTKFVNSGTYGKRYRGSRWSAEETELFYDALSQYGENYELIAYVLPGRDRKSCKNKFKVEDKKNPARINYCLENRIPVDMKTLSRMTGKDFSGPVPEIRAPPPLPPQILPTEETTNASDETPPQLVKKRGRSRSQRGASESGVVIIGDAESFES